jgi:hypothetical protein
MIGGEGLIASHAMAEPVVLFLLFFGFHGARGYRNPTKNAIFQKKFLRFFTEKTGCFQEF